MRGAAAAAAAAVVPLLLAGAVVAASGCDDQSVTAASDNICTPITQAGTAVGSGPSGLMPCATDATPDATQAIPLQIDTGGTFVGQPYAYTVGSAYGQVACPDQYLVEADLSAANAAGKNVFVAGERSLVLPAAPCEYKTTLTVWGYDGTSWTRFDQLTYEGQPFTLVNGDPGCHEAVTSRVIPSELGGASIPPNLFVRMRAAVVTTVCHQKVPVDIIAD